MINFITDSFLNLYHRFYLILYLFTSSPSTSTTLSLSLGTTFWKVNATDKKEQDQHYKLHQERKELDLNQILQYTYN